MTATTVERPSIKEKEKRRKKKKVPLTPAARTPPGHKRMMAFSVATSLDCTSIHLLSSRTFAPMGCTSTFFVAGSFRSWKRGVTRMMTRSRASEVYVTVRKTCPKKNSTRWFR